MKMEKLDDEELRWNIIDQCYDGGAVDANLFGYFVTLEQQIDPEKELINIFKQIDVNGDNVLSKNELVEGFKHRGIMLTKETVDAVVTMADTNKDGVIQLSEFKEFT
eukprot:UN04372